MRIAATAVTSLLPVLAITVLYVIGSTAGRLGAVAGFTLVFSVAVGVFTRGELVDVFVGSVIGSDTAAGGPGAGDRR